MLSQKERMCIAAFVLVMTDEKSEQREFSVTEDAILQKIDEILKNNKY